MLVLLRFLLLASVLTGPSVGWASISPTCGISGGPNVSQACGVLSVAHGGTGSTGGAITSITAGTGITLSPSPIISSGSVTANLSTGIAGSQSVIGGTASGETLTLSSTSNATKGKILFGTSAYDEVNNRLGIGTATPVQAVDIVGQLKLSSTATLSGDVSLASSTRLQWNADTTLRRKTTNNLVLGSNDAASPSAQALSVQNVVAGTTDGAGVALTITGSQGTGAGLGGSIIFQTAPASSTGSAQNALATVLTLDGTRTATFTNSSTATTAPVAAGPFEAIFTNTGTATNNYQSIGFVDSGGFLKGYMRWNNVNHTDSSASWALGISGNELATITSGGTWVYVNAMNAARFVPTASTVATNGMYLSATNVLDLSTNSIKALEINASQAVNMVGAVTMPGLASTSSAQTGTVCWTTSTGNLTVDTTTTCLLSSRRFKKDIVPMESKLAEIMALKPVTFQYKDMAMGLDHLSGLIAEDVAPLDKTLVEFDPQGQPYKVRYDGLAPILAKAMQEQELKIESLNGLVSDLIQDQRTHGQTHKCNAFCRTLEYLESL